MDKSQGQPPEYYKYMEFVEGLYQYITVVDNILHNYLLITLFMMFDLISTLRIFDRFKEFSTRMHVHIYVCLQDKFLVSPETKHLNLKLEKKLNYDRFGRGFFISD